ncbi:MAG TPA: GNAT family N-acetyltransferase [Streptosporangiaceae bacterium]
MPEPSFSLTDADDGLAERLHEEINAYNADVTGYRDGRLLHIAVRSADDDLLAGLAGWTWGGCGYIDVFWIRADQRGAGLGSRMLAAAEAEMRRRGCSRVALSTHSFQAPGFYARAGYTECGRSPDYPNGHSEIHLTKRLA